MAAFVFKTREHNGNKRIGYIRTIHSLDGSSTEGRRRIMLSRRCFIVIFIVINTLVMLRIGTNVMRFSTRCWFASNRGPPTSALDSWKSMRNGEVDFSELPRNFRTDSMVVCRLTGDANEPSKLSDELADCQAWWRLYPSLNTGLDSMHVKHKRAFLVNTLRQLDMPTSVTFWVDKYRRASCPAKEDFINTQTLPTVPLHGFLDGPGLNNSNTITATCRIAEFGERSQHLPHVMQQLLRCFAWWQANERKKPVLVDDDKLTRNLPFINMFIKGLESAFNVKVVSAYMVRSSPDLVYVRDNDGYDLGSTHNAAILRHKLLSTFSWYDKDKSNNCHNKFGSNYSLPVVGILNRRNTRRILNVDEIKERLQSNIKAEVRVIEFEERSYEDQVRFMAETDILISPHGAQLTSIFFLPTCASVVEIFPKGYWVPHFFGSLAHGAGLASHTALYTGHDRKRELAWNMETYERREKARAGNICVDSDKLVSHVRLLLKDWQSCCNNNAP
jgi:Glycosyltransferase 61